MHRADSPITGKAIVFTGKMVRGTRSDMQERARHLGAQVQTAVNTKTDYLVCGENVGKSKIEKAERLGTTILTESAYAELIGELENR
jgi:DNA ligase (NAD+)